MQNWDPKGPTTQAATRVLLWPCLKTLLFSTWHLKFRVACAESNGSPRLVLMRF